MTTGRRGVVWRTPDITADGLKLFACAAMLIQNIGIAVIENGIIGLDQYTNETLNQALAEDSRLMTLAGLGSVMQLLGGLAVPVFAFLLVEGYRNTSNWRGYLRNLVVFALLSEIPYDLAVGGTWVDFSSQNALITLAVCLLMLKCLEQVKTQGRFMSALLSGFIVLAAVLWVTILRAEFGLCMVLLVAVFELFYTRNVLKTLLGAAISLLYVTGPFSFYAIWCYNGVRSNRFPKYAYYLFYPLHLLALGVLAQILR